MDEINDLTMAVLMAAKAKGLKKLVITRDSDVRWLVKNGQGHWEMFTCLPLTPGIYSLTTTPPTRIG